MVPRAPRAGPSRLVTTSEKAESHPEVLESSTLQSASSPARPSRVEWERAPRPRRTASERIPERMMVESCNPSSR